MHNLSDIQDNKRITLKVYNEGLLLMDEDNHHLLGQIANYFIPRAEEDIIKVAYFIVFIYQINSSPENVFDYVIG